MRPDKSQTIVLYEVSNSFKLGLGLQVTISGRHIFKTRHLSLSDL